MYCILSLALVRCRFYYHKLSLPTNGEQSSVNKYLPQKNKVYEVKKCHTKARETIASS